MRRITAAAERVCSAAPAVARKTGCQQSEVQVIYSAAFAVNIAPVWPSMLVCLYVDPVQLSRQMHT